MELLLYAYAVLMPSTFAGQFGLTGFFYLFWGPSKRNALFWVPFWTCSGPDLGIPHVYKSIIYTLSWGISTSKLKLELSMSYIYTDLTNFIIHLTIHLIFFFSMLIWYHSNDKKVLKNRVSNGQMSKNKFWIYYTHDTTSIW